MLCIKNKLGEFIRKYRGKQSLREFASKCGISHTHLDSIEKGIDPRTGKSVRITIETLKKIANAMNMSVNDLLIQSGEVPDSQVKKVDNNKILYKYNNLSNEDKEILDLLKDLDIDKKKSIINFIKTFK